MHVIAGNGGSVRKIRDGKSLSLSLLHPSRIQSVSVELGYFCDRQMLTRLRLAPVQNIDAPPGDVN